MPNPFLMLFALLWCTTSFSQSITIAENAQLKIASSASIQLSGLQLRPNQTFTFPDYFTLKKENIPVSENSIEKFYHSSEPIKGFTGDISIRYSFSETNAIHEDLLVLRLKDSNGKWKSTPSEADPYDRLIGHSFTVPISFTALTLGKPKDNSTLGIGQKASVVSYPNPTMDIVRFQSSYFIQRIEVYNARGTLITSVENTDRVNLEPFQRAVYLVKLIDENQNFHYVKIQKI